jgi:hypothetical protein
MKRIKEIIIILFAIISARNIQEFLWGKLNDGWGIEEWLRMFRKRVAKLEEIELTNPHANIEFQKRLLQTAALCIALIYIIRKEGIIIENKHNKPTNLLQYKDKIDNGTYTWFLY